MEFIGCFLEEIIGEEIFVKYDGYDVVLECFIIEFYIGICMGFYNLIYLFDLMYIFIGGGIISCFIFIMELKYYMESFGLCDIIIEIVIYKN